MKEEKYRVYGYRFVVLGVFMLINAAIQILWICFAPITGPAAEYYGVSEMSIGFLAMSFMFVYIPISMPVSWVIDKLGYHKSVSIGALIMAVFGLLRGLLSANFSFVLVSTIGLAIAQPFMMNSISTVAAKWFPMKERATVGGLATIASFLGIAIGEVVSPILFLRYGIHTMLMIYGVISLVSAVLFVTFNREAPPTPPCPEGQETRALMMDGLKDMLKMKDMWILLALFLVGMGVFNGISTWIEGIVRSRGFTISQAGNLGGVLLLGGVIGAAIIPLLSDRLHKRKVFLMLGLILAVPGLVGVSFATSYNLIVASFFALGFFLMSLAPVGYQYGAEITFPSPEGTSNGLLNLAGQLSVVFIFSMEAFRSMDGSYSVSLIGMMVMMVAAALLVSRLSKSKVEIEDISMAVD